MTFFRVLALGMIISAFLAYSLLALPIELPQKESYHSFVGKKIMDGLVSDKIKWIKDFKRIPVRAGVGVPVTPPGKYFVAQSGNVTIILDIEVSVKISDVYVDSHLTDDDKAFIKRRMMRWKEQIMEDENKKIADTIKLESK